MKKILTILSVSFFVFAFATTAAAATPNWDITGTWTIPFTCTYNCPTGPWIHQLEVTFQNLTTGELAGNGGYIDGGTTYLNTWDITSGAVSGDGIDFNAHYTSNAPDCNMHVWGTIASDGLSMSGNWSDDCGGARGGTWTATGEAQSLDQDGDGYYSNVDDCDDTDAAINPGATEVCDGVDNDCDGEVDTHACNWYCAPTDEDPWEINYKKLGTDGFLGVNRHMWTEEGYFTTLVPAGKNGYKVAASSFSLEDTNGCSCLQILEKLQEYSQDFNLDLYGEMEGHQKYGCSKSVMEEFTRLVNTAYRPLTGTWLLSVNGGTYMHDMIIVTQSLGGTLTGTGGYPWTGPPYSYPYNWTMTGNLSAGNVITMTITYQNGYTATIFGPVNTATWNYMSGGPGTGGVTSWSATRVP